MELHEKYAPILHFARGERFFPMSAEDFLGYAEIRHKGEDKPLVARGQVRRNDLTRLDGDDIFLRSVRGEPLSAILVTRQWSADTVWLLQEYSRLPLYRWTETIARQAYAWFSDRTKPATKHFWWNKLLMSDDILEVFSGDHAGAPRFRLPESVRKAALEGYESSQGSRPNYCYYYRPFRQGEYLCLQYWFLYAYNDWAAGFGGFNDHEGDWEGIQLFFRLLPGGSFQEPPAYITYLGHESRITKPWNHHDVQKQDTHPHVFVAAGSHATYPEAKAYPILDLFDLVDYATGDERTLDHSEWRSRVNLGKMPWLTGFRGSWGTRYWLPLEWLRKSLGRLVASIPGEISLPGVSAPRGPQFGDAGSVRESWGSPVPFAGVKELG